MKPAGLILAAGESSRMGSPKALLPYRGETFLDRLIGILRPRCCCVIVVLGASAEQVRSGVKQSATFVINHDYKSGQTSSMQCGLRVVPAEASSVLFTLVDHPAVSEYTVDAVVAQAEVQVCVPRYKGKRGHPILFSRALMQEFLALPAATGAANAVVRAHAHETTFLDLDDPGIVADIDDPDAYRNLLETSA